ncbi:unnamed protein product [Meganyctiphanes norvegica]|uniref:RING-type domain-containing protein n=1 Tax=Meganyctiphanes norvegica TaxID=48144 RepID=A0AAV2QC72_MEGNR
MKGSRSMVELPDSDEASGENVIYEQTRVEMPDSDNTRGDGVETPRLKEEEPSWKKWIKIIVSVVIFNLISLTCLIGFVFSKDWIRNQELTIFKEEYQWFWFLITFILIYCIGHFSYWYCKRNGLFIFNKDKCSICLEVLLTKPNASLSCKHVFHERCIKNWLKRESTCPNCRKTAQFIYKHRG